MRVCRRNPWPGRIAVAALVWLAAVRVPARTAPGLRLAVELAGEGDHAGAALEFRRLAVAAPLAVAKGGYYWAAAFEYHAAGEPVLSDRMLDRAEDADPELGGPALLLRGENARVARQWKQSAFYFESLRRAPAEDPVRIFAGRRLAECRLRQRDLEGAREALALTPEPQSEARAALETYARGRDRSPKLGGLLGLVPGFGYFYSGEWANGVRSLLLNSLFLFGMVNAADRDQWGAFAVIGFFEFTWYSGSIYGGMDAAHRYNRDRLETAVRGVEGGARFEPDPARWPAVSLKFHF